jgi:hypothetical protein
MRAAFVFKNPDYGGAHTRGNVRCQACWDDFPRLCGGEGCSGLMHAHNSGVQRDGKTMVTSRCDRCGRHLAAA